MRLFRVGVAAAALLAVISAGNVALAHAAYKSSDPPHGGRVSAPPSQVSAEFTEPLAGGSYLQITDACGERVDGGDISISGYTMSVSMSGASAGRYTVFYKAYSQLDPHVTQGEFTFTSSSGDPCPGAAPEPEPEEQGAGGSASGAGSSDGDTQTSGSSSASNPAPTGSDGGSGSTGSTKGRDSKADSDASGGGGRSSVGRQRARVSNVVAAAPTQPRSRPVWDGIRLDSFLTGLLLAAIIGAAGGKIYAGIMGPRA